MVFFGMVSRALAVCARVYHLALAHYVDRQVRCRFRSRAVVMTLGSGFVVGKVAEFRPREGFARSGVCRSSKACCCSLTLAGLADVRIS